jgi:CTP:molybdopterin cytidylyltransferase MocA
MTEWPEFRKLEMELDLMNSRVIIEGHRMLSEKIRRRSAGKVMQGLILAAGSGTRLGPFTNAIPKELLPVGEKAVIEHVVKAMKLAGIEDIAILVNSHKHRLSDYLGSGRHFGVRLTYVGKDERRGLADAGI